MKEFCKCGHSKKSHVMDGENTRCCVCWQNPNKDHLSMCECMKYEKDELPKKAVEGMMSALKDVENGDYITLVDNTRKRKETKT